MPGKTAKHENLSLKRRLVPVATKFESGETKYLGILQTRCIGFSIGYIVF